MEKLQQVLKVSRAHSAKVPQAKRANDNFYNAVQVAAAQQLQNQALRNAASLGVVGLGAGAAGRGLTGLVQLINRNMSKPRRSYPPAIPVDLPLQKQDEEAPDQPKFAASADFLRGDYAQSVGGVPWAIPAAVGAGAAGMYGGWNAMDYLLDKRRKGDLEAELEQAKQEYEAALMSNAGGKQAADGTLAADLDKLYDAVVEKQSQTSGEKKATSAADWAGFGLGNYGIYAGATGLTGAMLAYSYAKKRQRRAVIERALKERRKRRFSSQPAAMYVRPTTNQPTVPKTMQTAPTLDEHEGLEL
jgi:hypothetical protein